MKLLIDHRERKVLEIAHGVCEQIEIVSLPLADILIVGGSSGAVAIERKTVIDFVSSIRSNRLWEQLLRLMKTDRILNHKIVRRVLVIHGSFKEYLDGFGFSELDSSKFWASLMGAFMETLYVYETPLIVAESDLAFTSFLRIMIKREERNANEKLPPSRWYRKRAPVELPVKDRKLYVLDSIPLIGNAQAKILLEHFGTIEKV
ncbi:MAG: ERCC4 domain-containing protein, partial [Thermoproteota archaeon]